MRDASLIFAYFVLILIPLLLMRLVCRNRYAPNFRERKLAIKGIRNGNSNSAGPLDNPSSPRQIWDRLNLLNYRGPNEFHYGAESIGFAPEWANVVKEEATDGDATK